MTIHLLLAVGFGASVAFAIITDFWKDSNEIGSSEGNDVYFSNQFTITDAKDRVRSRDYQDRF